MLKIARTAFTSVCLLSLIGFAREARAIPIANDVDLDWQNGRFASSSEFVTILGMPRLILEGDDPANLVFDIDVVAHEELQGLNLAVRVVDGDGNEYQANGRALLLLTPQGPAAPWEWFYDKGLDPLDNADDDPTHARLKLSDFLNFDLLPTSGDWIFLLSGSFFGDVNLGQDTPPPLPPYTGPLRITVTASGAGTPWSQPCRSRQLSRCFSSAWEQVSVYGDGVSFVSCRRTMQECRST